MGQSPGWLDMRRRGAAAGRFRLAAPGSAGRRTVCAGLRPVFLGPGGDLVACRSRLCRRRPGPKRGGAVLSLPSPQLSLQRLTNAPNAADPAMPPVAARGPALQKVFLGLPLHWVLLGLFLLALSIKLNMGLRLLRHGLGSTPTGPGPGRGEAGAVALAVAVGAASGASALAAATGAVVMRPAGRLPDKTTRCARRAWPRADPPRLPAGLLGWSLGWSLG